MCVCAYNSTSQNNTAWFRLKEAARAPGGCGLYVRSREVIPSRNHLTNPVSQRSSPWRPHVAERHTEVAGGSRPHAPSLLTRSHGLRRGLCRAGTHSPGSTARALGCGCCPWVTLGGRAGTLVLPLQSVGSEAQIETPGVHSHPAVRGGAWSQPQRHR